MSRGTCQAATGSALKALLVRKALSARFLDGPKQTPAAHRALGCFPAGAVRFSFGRYNAEPDVDAALRAVEEIAGT